MVRPNAAPVVIREQPPQAFMLERPDHSHSVMRYATNVKLGARYWAPGTALRAYVVRVKPPRPPGYVQTRQPPK